MESSGGGEKIDTEKRRALFSLRYSFLRTVRHGETGGLSMQDDVSWANVLFDLYMGRSCWSAKFTSCVLVPDRYQSQSLRATQNFPSEPKKKREFPLHPHIVISRMEGWKGPFEAVTRAGGAQQPLGDSDLPVTR